MKIVTWNINGIRTVRGPLKTLLDSFDADIICLQETKVTREMLDEGIAVVDGYNAYFSYSRKKSGYSGVVTYCRDSARPVAAEEGLSGHWSSMKAASTLDSVGVYGRITDYPSKELQELDAEGRTVVTEHRFRRPDGTEGTLCVINVYCPRADKEREDRKAYKLWFCEMLQVRTEAMLAQGRHVIVLGDLNTSHRPIDTCDSSGDDYATSPTRVWLDGFLCESSTATDIQLDYQSADPGHRMIDTFRQCHPGREKAYTCWSTATGARTLNYGCRIDYILCDVQFANSCLAQSEILPETAGSDHCPVMSEFDALFLPAVKCPSLCAKWMPEFTGKQQKLSTFFQKAAKQEVEDDQSVRGRLRLTDTVSSTKIAKPGAKRKNDFTTGQVQRSVLDFYGSKVKKVEVEGSPTSQSSISFPVVRTASVTGSSAVSFDVSEEFESSSLPDFVDIAEMDEEEDLLAEFAIETAGSSSYNGSSSSSGSSSQGPSSQPDSQWVKSSSQESAAQWRSLLRGPDAAPLCNGHGEPCILKTCRKAGPNRNRQFYMCSRPEGEKTDKSARCASFKWIGKGGSVLRK
ncbi:DNA-(apurinic or apyrimidinic site) lyase 2 [Hypsibius exemplaris]|uniref:DNA-(apurinic or apyrimidinic site) endonuclease n=1 Tax=Hypsibius exemplaris TaxID=2072580 RepID=A0A1W0WI20_HYPEX|nr:DNA-(apurinic or apyrimidinic site) lyase 2 [Hypsibius exemplaris]